MTFTETWTVDVGDERVIARHYGRAHTSGDAVITFENANVVHMGDLMFNQRHPLVDRPAGALLRNWMRVLDQTVQDHAPDTVYIFGLDEQMDHDERYARAREFYDVVTGLWDSFAEDAFVRDVENGVYFDPARMHTLGHKGKYLSVRGPLNIARPVQGWPVIVQAGASDAGRQLAAEVAEVIFSGVNHLPDAQSLYADIKSRAEKAGRKRDHIKILPGCFVVVGDTVEEARKKKALLDSRVHPDSGIGTISAQLGFDATGFDLDGPLPEIPETNAGKTGRQRLIDMARRENLTVRELAQRVGGSFGSLEMIGTPETIADQMEMWLKEEGSDGFNVLFPWLPGGLNEFCERVVPELQRRGLFRREYEGKTLRENLGLPRPKNQFFDQ
jgi:alkanesulfonate monooxygenase